MRKINIIFLIVLLINSNAFADRGLRGGENRSGRRGHSNEHSYSGGKSFGSSKYSESHGSGESSSSNSIVAPAIVASAAITPTATLSSTSSLTAINQTLIDAIVNAKDSITKNAAVHSLMNSLSDSIDIGSPNKSGQTILDIFINDGIIRDQIFNLADEHLQNAILSDNAAEAISSLEICAVFNDTDIKKSKINVQPILISTKSFIQNVNCQDENNINQLLNNNLTVVNGCYSNRRTARSFAENNRDLAHSEFKKHASIGSRKRWYRADRIAHLLRSKDGKDYNF